MLQPCLACLLLVKGLLKQRQAFEMNTLVEPVSQKTKGPEGPFAVFTRYQPVSERHVQTQVVTPSVNIVLVVYTLVT